MESSSDPTAVATELHSATIQLLRRVRQEDDRLGIHPARLSALSVLVFGGPMRLTDLARAEHVKPPTMTRIVDALESDGLVTRSPVPDDARAVRLEATDAGIRVMHEGRRNRVERLTRALEKLPPEELDLLDRAASVIRRVASGL